ncbi:MAG: hypothetical protein WBA57_16145 [Elainellaceae cyanobacterium]
MAIATSSPSKIVNLKLIGRSPLSEKHDLLTKVGVAVRFDWNQESSLGRS